MRIVRSESFQIRKEDAKEFNLVSNAEISALTVRGNYIDSNEGKVSLVFESDWTMLGNVLSS